MDSSEGSHPTTRSGIVRAKPTVSVDSKKEPAREGLPDGWLKEYRPRKTRSGSRSKGDMFYIDPTNGYEFRSLKDVYRYLESGDISNCVMVPNKRKIEDLHFAGNQSQHTGRPSDYRQLDTADESNPEGRENSENMPSSEPKGVSKGKLTELKLQKARVPNQSLEHESATGEEANVEQKPKEKKHKTKPVKRVAAPLRASPRLAALKIDQDANNVPKDGPVSTQTDIADQLQPKRAKNPKPKANSSLLPQKKDGSHSASASENAENKYPSAPEQILGASVAYCTLTDECQNAPAEVPVPPQQIGLVETAEPMPGSALSSLLGSIWSDPCLEFAFRTLTGDIPVLDDTLAVANYLLPPQDLNKGTTPNCSSSAYDGARNHTQVDRVRLPRPRPSDKLYSSSSWFPPQ